MFLLYNILTPTLIFAHDEEHKSTISYNNIRKLPPKSGEKFVATKQWQRIEPIAWRIATNKGLRDGFVVFI